MARTVISNSYISTNPDVSVACTVDTNNDVVQHVKQVTGYDVSKVAIAASSSGNNTIKGAVTDKIIRVHSLYLVAAGTVSVTFQSGAGGNAISGRLDLVANSGIVLPYNPDGWFETAAGVLLNASLSGAVYVGGGCTYALVG